MTSIIVVGKPRVVKFFKTQNCERSEQIDSLSLIVAKSVGTETRPGPTREVRWTTKGTFSKIDKNEATRRLK